MFYRSRKESSKLGPPAKVSGPKNSTSSSTDSNKGVIVGPSQPITVQLHQLRSNPLSPIQEDGEIPHCSTTEPPTKQIHTPGSSKPVTKQVQQSPAKKDAHRLPKHGSTHPSTSISADHSMGSGSWGNLAPVELQKDEEPQAMASPGFRLPPLKRPRRGSLWKTLVQGEGLHPKRKLPKIGTADVEMDRTHGSILLF